MLWLTRNRIKLHHGTLRRFLSLGERRQSAAVLPESADVVVIGGGSAGCHTLYQLAKRGVNAVLLERAKVTSGTTWHTAGCLWRLRPNDVDTQLLNDTRDVLMQLEADTGLHPGWLANGGLFIADRKERLDEYERLATAGLSFNVESSIKSPKETKELFPLIDDKAIIGSLYSPGDGVIDPAMLCAALTKGASKRGAKVIENCRVLNIITEENMMGSKQVREVVTSHGNIRTKCVVNCAGVWATDLAAMVGMQIPLIPMKHSYIVSESIPEVRGLPNIRDHDSSTYFRMQGESICMGGYENNPIILDKVPADFEFSLYELDWSAFSANMQGAIKLVPAFEKVGIKTTVCGPESFTPDHKALLGEDPCVRGFYYHCGHNSSGMMLGGGCGIQMAQWIVNGRPDLHMFNYDIRRFLPTQRKNREWSICRSHESYTRNYYIIFPHDERLAGRNVIQGPLHQEHLEAGCVFQERQGFERPGWFAKGGPAPIQKYDWYGAYGNVPHAKHRYADLLELDYTFDFTGNHDMIGEECLACRENVALFDMSSAGKFYLSGADAMEAVNWLFTSEIKDTVGRTTYTCALNSKAGAEADLTVSSIQPGTGGQVDPVFKGNGFYIVTGGGSYYHCWAHLKEALAMKNFNANLVDVSNKIGILSLQGPKSQALLQSLVDEDISEGTFQYCSNKLIKVAGHICRAIRISFVGELGWELHVPWDSCAPVYQAIMAQGAKHGLRNAGYRALDSLSCEKGYVLWHADLQSCDNPLEAGLGFLCRKSGSFLGKEALDKVRENGPAKKLAFFQLQEKVPVWGLETILRDGQVVGYLRRGEYGYALGASIGKGYVKHPEGLQVTPEFLLNGHYQLEVLRKRYDVTLHLKSPFDPKGKRLHGVYDDVLPIRQ